MIGKEFAGFDRLLVAAIDQRHAIAAELDEVTLGHRLGRGGDQRRHFGSGGRRIV